MKEYNTEQINRDKESEREREREREKNATCITVYV